MKANFVQLNLSLAWLWILLGFASGMILGLFFHDENWLGGYGSFKRRMYRLTHISFFGLGATNLLFWLTMENLRCADSLAEVASWAFVGGALSMPLCCVVMAHFPKANLIFAVPVISLLLGGVLMFALLLRQPAELATRAIAATTTQPSAASNFRFQSPDFPSPAHNATSPSLHSVNPF
jgi:uncharacterized membrane protein YdcZ (DUF606 family)